ncbi:TF, partial [Lemmus lemmus]
AQFCVSQPHSSGNEVIIRARKEGGGENAGYWAIGLCKHGRSKIAPSQPAPDIKGSRSQRRGAEVGWPVFPPLLATHPGRMKSAVGTLLACAALGLCLAVPDKTVKWCAISEHENTKCNSFRDHMKTVLPDGPQLACVKKTSYTDCIKAIAGSEADAITLDAGWVYEAGLTPNNLKPVVAEVYGTPEKPQTSYLAVAVVKKGSGFQMDELQGKSKDFQLFDSPLEKDLLFKNSAIGLLRIPSRMDYRLYLGHNYVTAIRNVREGQCKYSGKAR